MLFKYLVFAVISTFVNIGLQVASFAIYNGKASLLIAMVAGTLGGLILKYILDKKYIFNYTATTRKDDGIKFLLYSSMGVVTTIIFFVTEILFDTLFSSIYSKYIGAVFGLSIGYTIKYFLDKKIVFKGDE